MCEKLSEIIQKHHTLLSWKYQRELIKFRMFQRLVEAQNLPGGCRQMLCTQNSNGLAEF